MTPLSRLLLGLLFTAALFAQDHLLISEFAVSPTAGEFVEIHNPTGAAIDLSDYYLTDGTRASSNDYYYNLVSGAVSVLSTDFIARFPDGASIAPGEYQTVAMSGSAFRTTYGQDPTYEVIDSDAQLTNMREALSGSIGGSSGLSNNGEVLILFFWDGAADLVADVDYAVWGDKEEGVDKTGISADGPDADSDSSAFLNDTALDQQISVSSSTPHADGESVQRLSLTEIGETASGGNGITGHDETSENLAQAFTAAAASPNSAPPASQPPVVGSISISPSIPTSSDSVLVSATLTDDVAIGAGRLYYSIDGGAYDSTGMDNLPGGDQYVAGILPQPENTVVSYVVRAIDSDGQSDYSDTLSYTVSAPAQLTPIADIQANPGNYSNVIIEGVVVIGAGVIDADRSRIYVQDNSGRGILCFSSAAPSTLPAGLYERGNLVRVIGSVTEFEGVTEIDNFSGELISTGNPIPDALELSTQGAGDVSLEGTYIQTTGTITDLASGLGGGTNVGLDDGSGQVTIRVWDDTGIDLSAFSLGGEMTVRGVLGIFNAATQVTPGYQDEVTAPGVNPGDGSGTATISPDSVGTGQSLAATLTVSGDPSYTLAEVSVSIPAGWNWSNNAADVALSGSGFGGASAVVSGGQIRVSGAAVSSTASGSVTINNLTASSNNTTSTFTVRTATDGGSLVAIASSPRVIVGLGGPPITPISDIQANPTAFSTVTIEGVVTVGANTIITSRTEAYIQDESGRGINVFSFDAPNVEPNPLLVRGNRLRMTGTVEEFQGITEITNYTIELLGEDQPLPAPLVLSTNAAGDLSLEGTRVEVTGIATIGSNAGGGQNISVDDGSGAVLVRVWASTGVDYDFISDGDTVRVTAVVDIFSEATQLVPAVQADLGLVNNNVVIGDGNGTITLDSTSVAAGASGLTLTASVSSDQGDTLRTVWLTVPFNWSWSGSAADVALSGSGFDGASVEIQDDQGAYRIAISSAFLTGANPGQIQIANLGAPNQNVYAYFWAQTAVAGGTPAYIDASPAVAVGSAPIHLMRDIQTNPDQFGDAVTVRGVVTIGDNIIRQDRVSAYFQDRSGSGLNINESGAPQSNYVRGDSIEVTGTISLFGGTTQIDPTSFSVIANDVDGPAPASLTTAEAFGPRWDGTYIQIQGIIVEKFSTNPTAVNPDYNMVINDGSGAITARVWGTTGIELDSFSVNDAVVIRGIGDVFVQNGVNNYQIVPGYQDHVELDAAFQPSLKTVKLSVPPHPFAPDQGEVLTIAYNTGSINNYVNVRIFDLGGRLVATLVDENATLVDARLDWDGRDIYRNNVPLGVYICLLEVVEPQTGEKRVKKAPIVVGTLLK